MLKKGLLFILTVFVFLSLTSCGLDYRYSLDESLHNQIEVVKEDDNLAHHLIYQGDKYVSYGDYYQSHKDDVMLSWNGYRYIWYIDEDYSYTSEKPLFIYNKTTCRVYFREDYDYTTDTFVIENTESEIVWKDMFGQRNDDLSLEGQVEVEIHSKQYLRINTSIELTMIDGTWYMSFPYTSGAWVVSDEFVNVLSENGII